MRHRTGRSLKPVVVRPVLAAALAYATEGIPVFPLSWDRRTIRNCDACRPGAPCPGRDACRCGTGTCHGFYAATTDAATITRWFSEHPDWQLALRTGKSSDLVVLDVDLDKGGLDSLLALQKAGLDIRGTGAQLSGSGQSFHLFYAWPGARVPNSQGALGPGLDVRGDGGFIVAAPSRHPATGERYELLGPLRDLTAWPWPSASSGADCQEDLRSVTVPTWLDVGGRSPCSAVSAAAQVLAVTLAAEAGHQVILKPLLRLLRLHQQGHAGVASAVLQAKEAFMQARLDRRSRAEAEREFDAALDGARQRMSPPRQRKAHACCPCQRAALRWLIEQGRGLSTGLARTTETRVLRHLLMRADQRGSWMISGESQRVIAESIDVHQPTVSKVLKRLEAHGYLKRTGPSEYLLQVPDALKELSIEEPSTAGTSIDNSVRASVHRLFGAGGLAGSRADTFAALSEWQQPYGRGHLVRVRAGSKPSDRLIDPYQGLRQIPRPATEAVGRTAAELARSVCRSASTVRKHLAGFEADGLAFRVAGLWWRARFDPEVLADELAVVDTAERKSQEYLRERRLRFDRLCELLDEDGEPIYVRDVSEQGAVVYVLAKTGEVKWRDLEPLLYRKVELG